MCLTHQPLRQFKRHWKHLSLFEDDPFASFRKIISRGRNLRIQAQSQHLFRIKPPPYQLGHRTWAWCMLHTYIHTQHTNSMYLKASFEALWNASSNHSFISLIQFVAKCFEVFLCCILNYAFPSTCDDYTSLEFYRFCIQSFLSHWTAKCCTCNTHFNNWTMIMGCIPLKSTLRQSVRLIELVWTLMLWHVVLQISAHSAYYPVCFDGVRPRLAIASSVFSQKGVDWQKYLCVREIGRTLNQPRARTSLLV